MTPDEFRRAALGLPGATESAHQGHPDFRAGPKQRIFATLGYPDDQWAMVKVSRDQQTGLVQSRPDIFQPVKGAWGEKGSTQVRLDRAAIESVTKALQMAWENASA